MIDNKQNNINNVCVIIPTFNNDGTVVDVLSGVLKYTENVILVDDGSTDETPNLLSSNNFSITIIRYEKNKGKGYALKQGFFKALELGYTYAITIDADGQHYPNDLPFFFEEINKNPGSLLVGSRNLENNDNVPDKNKFANKFSNFWFYLQTGLKLKDTQTGYRLYPIKKMKGIKYISNRYESELELLVFSAWRGVKIIPIPINVYYPPEGERVSHFRPTKDFIRITILNTFLCFGAVFYGLPLRLINYVKKRW